ncbi:MAG TPA: hypothetical protein VIL99_11220 [Ignavibacteria bacterium]
MKQADNFGRDYTLYVSKKEESEEAERESKKLSKMQRNPKENWNMPVKKEMIFFSEKPKKALFTGFFLWSWLFI